MKAAEAKTWRLTDGFAKKPPRVPDGKNPDDYIFFDDKLQGFGLRVRKGFGRTWIAQYKVRGKTKRRKLGAAEGPFAVDAKDVRSAAETLLAQVQLGANPQGARDGPQILRPSHGDLGPSDAQGHAPEVRRIRDQPLRSRSPLLLRQILRRTGHSLRRPRRTADPESFVDYGVSEALADPIVSWWLLLIGERRPNNCANM